MAATCNPSFVWWQQVGAEGYDFVEAVATLLITAPVVCVPVSILAFPSSVPPHTERLRYQQGVWPFAAMVQWSLP